MFLCWKLSNNRGSDKLLLSMTKIPVEPINMLLSYSDWVIQYILVKLLLESLLPKV